jgi:ABC-type maltose transport system permease subunit
MNTLKKYKEQILTTTMVAMFPTFLTLVAVFDLCKHCPGH